LIGAVVVELIDLGEDQGGDVSPFAAASAR
jgi:hypothetical protein